MMEAPVHYAGFWRRAAASLIDTMLFAVTLAPFIALFTSGNYFYTSEADNTLALSGVFDWGYLLLSDILPVVAVVYFWHRFEGTPGKWLFDCHVVDGLTFKPLTLKQSVVRYLSYFISLMPLGVGFLWVAFDRRKRGFHDLIAGSVVVVRCDETQDNDESQKSLAQLIKEASWHHPMPQ